MTFIAAIPIFVLLILLGVLRRPAWMASLAGLAAAIAVAMGAYHMPLPTLIATVTYGAAFGLFPIGWVVFSAILLYRVMQESGKFNTLKDSIGHLTDDGRLQMMLVAFAFGAFIEGCAGFGTPVAVAATMLTGLGFSPFLSAAVCLLANTAPVAFGSIGTPILTLRATTALPLDRLSAGVGRICAPVSLFIPAYMIAVVCGWSGLRAVLPAAAVCGIAFGGTQFLVSNFVGPELTDILASMAAMGGLFVLVKFWKPRDRFDFGHLPPSKVIHKGRDLAVAWAPYMILVVLVLLWGYPPVKARLDSFTIPINWPGLHNLIQRMPPVVAQPSNYGAVFAFNWLSASGTACLITAILGAAVVGLSPGRFARVFGQTVKQLAVAELTRSRLCDELFGCHCDVRSGFRGHGRAVSVVQLSAWFLGRFPYRKRHFCECAVWHTANRDGHKTRYESDPDGFRKLCRRRDGKDDQPDQHCRCRCRNDNEAGRRRPALWVYAQAQHLSHLHHRAGGDVLYVCGPAARTVSRARV